MNQRNHIWKGAIYAISMLILILDAKTTVSAATGGITLCLYTVIPSLFPFMMISILLNSALSDVSFRFIQPLGKILRIPRGSENILISGFLGGYPVGAQAVAEAWKNGSLSRTQAHQMLGFCSNAGPAFIFGMAASVFSNSYVLWVLWAIHIFSALLVAQLLPRTKSPETTSLAKDPLSLSDALEKTIRGMAGVCGWVIMFRVIIGFAGRWLLWLLPKHACIGICGLLELANGCTEACSVGSEGLRFILISAFLGFGGLCVLAQTMSVTRELGLGYYFPGKLLQGIISSVLALLAQHLIFAEDQVFQPPAVLYLILILSIISISILISQKKTVAISGDLMYNRKKVLW